MPDDRPRIRIKKDIHSLKLSDNCGLGLNCGPGLRGWFSA